MLQAFFSKCLGCLGLSSLTAAGADTVVETVTEADTVIETVTETVTEAVTEAAQTFDFHPGAFVTSLKYMAAGMAGIFLVIGAIILTIVLLGWLTSRKKKDGEEK